LRQEIGIYLFVGREEGTFSFAVEDIWKYEKEIAKVRSRWWLKEKGENGIGQGKVTLHTL
jgi:hypothetical protein